jgi:hypothetical protein
MSTPTTRTVLRHLSKYVGGGIVVTGIPMALWYKYALDKRHVIEHDVQTRIRIPYVQDADDLLLAQCQAGDVLVFDRRWERCAAGPWAALACWISKLCVCNVSKHPGNVVEGQFDHIGKIRMCVLFILYI